MTNTLKRGLTAAAFGMILGLSNFASAEAAPLQSSAVQQVETKRPVAAEETKVQHDRRITGSIGSEAATPYMMSPKKPLNMDCKLGFNPTSSSSCNY